MGNAIITENVGEGLYKARIVYDMTALDTELEKLKKASEGYWRELNQALDNRTALRKDKAAAGATLNALIELWKANVLQKLQPVPPVVPEDADPDGKNPATGQPYTDAERKAAVKAEVLTKINAERTAAGLSPLTESTAFNDAANIWNAARGTQGGSGGFTPGTADGYLETLLRMKSIQEDGKTEHDRILASIPGAVIVKSGEANGAGLFSSDAVVQAWKADPDTWVAIMDPDATRLGVDYDYQPQHPAANLWSAVTAKLADTPPGNSDFFASPAGQDLIDHVASTRGQAAADALYSSAQDVGGGTWQENWQPNTFYGAGATVKGTVGGGGNDILAQSLGSGTSGETQPLWPGAGGYAGDGGLTWLVLSDIPPRITIAVDGYYGW